MKWVLLVGILLLAACTTSEGEPIKEPGSFEAPIKLEKCEDNDELPCLEYDELLDEFNYCSTEEDCILTSELCGCGNEDNPGKAVNILEKENYDSYIREYCSLADFECSNFKSLKNHEYKAGCYDGICKAVRIA